MNLRDIYAEKALSQVPRLLGLQDRNEYSPTYGSFKRDYWLDRAVDHVDALPQFGVHTLALVYSHKFPNNMFYQKEKIKRWSIAGMDYWAGVQKKDGSFDEFYPNEHGWAGPTGFLLYAVLESYGLLKDGIPNQVSDKILEASNKAAKYLIKYDEPGILSNHHAIALTAIYSAYKTLQDEKIARGFEKKLRYFLTLQSKEGWGLEYDGPDIGYASANVSFLGKLYKMNPDPRVLKVIKDTIEFSSYFVYPDRHYGGSMGSRQTVHFYPHGYEIFSRKIPLAAKIADEMLLGLKQGKLVPPEIMADRYFLYRIPEFLQAWLEYKPRQRNLPKLPYEQKPFVKNMDHARIYIVKTPDYYMLVNAGKGGVVKIFSNNKLIYNDNGIIGKFGKSAVTSQWVDMKYKTDVKPGKIVVSGKLHKIPSKVFTPVKGLVFKSGMLALGWNTEVAYRIKGLIRWMLIFGSKEVPVKFKREIEYRNKIKVTDTIKILSNKKFKSLQVGDDFLVRYVPQSRYFQPMELETDGFKVDNSSLRRLNKNKGIVIKRIIDTKRGSASKFL